jgi:glycosyltransferase involved in cell wall biosynthesis
LDKRICGNLDFGYARCCMIRVLHLSSSTPDFQTQRLMAALNRHAGKGFSIATRTIGRGGDYRNWLSAYFRATKRDAMAFDVIHAFSIQAMETTVRRGLTVLSLPAISDRSTIARMRANANDWPLGVVCASAGDLAVCEAWEMPVGACHLIPPPVDFDCVPAGRNDQLRAALGFARDDQVFLLPGEADKYGGHRDALWTISILHVLYPNCRALLWGRGDKVEVLDRLSGKLRQPKLLTIAERKLGRRVEFEELLAAADTALLVPQGPVSLLPLGLCMAAGLPIVAGASRWVGDWLADGRNAAVVSEPSPRRLAQRIVEMRGDPAFCASIRAAARADAKRMFRADRIVRAYRSIYRTIAEDAEELVTNALKWIELSENQ